ncbi:transposase [Pseudomonas sp. NKUCC02_KPG]|uniref:transposase n=1 Tax=Pseudomonas sp. NKUCC02_KPG TaxID=2842124 RepID=UPI0035A8532E
MSPLRTPAPGRPPIRPTHPVAYDSPSRHPSRAETREHGEEMTRKSKPGLPRLFDRPKYRQRNVIERMFGWLKENRRLVTRVDKLAKSYGAMV